MKFLSLQRTACIWCLDGVEVVLEPACRTDMTPTYRNVRSIEHTLGHMHRTYAPLALFFFLSVSAGYLVALCSTQGAKRVSE